MARRTGEAGPPSDAARDPAAPRPPAPRFRAHPADGRSPRQARRPRAAPGAARHPATGTRPADQSSRLARRTATPEEPSQTARAQLSSGGRIRSSGRPRAPSPRAWSYPVLARAAPRERHPRDDVDAALAIGVGGARATSRQPERTCAARRPRRTRMLYRSTSATAADSPRTVRCGWSVGKLRTFARRFELAAAATHSPNRRDGPATGRITRGTGRRAPARPSRDPTDRHRHGAVRFACANCTAPCRCLSVGSRDGGPGARRPVPTVVRRVPRGAVAVLFGLCVAAAADRTAVVRTVREPDRPATADVRGLSAAVADVDAIGVRVRRAGAPRGPAVEVLGLA